MEKLTKVVFPTPCMPLTPTNKGGAALPEDENFNRCIWRFFMMKGMQGISASSYSIFQLIKSTFKIIV